MRDFGSRMIDRETFPCPVLSEPGGRLVYANELLDALPPAARMRLQERRLVVHANDVLFDCQQTPDVYFPSRSTVLSLVRTTDEGPQVEVGMVGSEGFAGLDVMLARGTQNETAAIVQTAGEIACISARLLHAEFSSEPQTRMLISTYAAMFLEHVSQTAVCNGVHTIAQRLAKWLLALHERTGSTHLVVSHEALSRILGTQRPAVTLAIGALKNAAVIAHSRRSIHLHNLPALRARACACSHLMHDSLSAFRAQLGQPRTASARPVTD
jgi:CRP-like cAMP-binding protein